MDAHIELFEAGVTEDAVRTESGLGGLHPPDPGGRDRPQESWTSEPYPFNTTGDDASWLGTCFPTLLIISFKPSGHASENGLNPFWRIGLHLGRTDAA